MNANWHDETTNWQGEEGAAGKKTKRSQNSKCVKLTLIIIIIIIILKQMALSHLLPSILFIQNNYKTILNDSSNEIL